MSVLVSIIKVLAAVAVLAVLLLVAYLLHWIREDIGKPVLENSVLAEKLEPKNLPDVEPGSIVFQDAVELLATGNLEEAEEKLLFIVNYYPAANAADEARRIVGEMNLDRLLSTDQMEGKEKYVVKRGDSYLAIASRHDTTLDCIMHLNDLQRTDRLHPGDELILMALDFSLTVDVARERLSLWKDGRFVKAYPLLAVRVGDGSREVLRTTVKNKSGEVAGRAYPPASLQYRNADKVISLAAGRLFLREMPGEAPESLGRGFYLSEADMEELALVLRVGNEVEVRFASE